MKTWKQNVKHLTSKQYELLREMCRLSKNVYNESLYNIRQHWFSEGSYLTYVANYPLVKTSDNYSRLGARIAQQTMRSADASFKSFFGLIRLAKSGKYECWKVRMPKYLSKNDMFKICFTGVQIKDGKFRVPTTQYLRKKYSDQIWISIPPYIRGKKIHQIHIVPKHKGKFFEVRYMFDDVEPEKVELDSTKALGIDLGVNNLATCVTSTGESFIIDGRKLKSINQWHNKELARLSRIKDKQGIKGWTNRQYLITRKRNNRVQDYVYCAAKKIVDYCIKNSIGNVVVGYNDGFQDNPDLGRVNNQNFVMIPFGKFKSRLEYLCKQHGINYVEQEESYTSKASFFDNDEMPKWNPVNPIKATFSGKRVKRGFYQTKSGKFVNADVNAALNILRKSNLTDLSVLQSRGYVNEPLRIRVSSGQTSQERNFSTKVKYSLQCDYCF